MAISPQKKKRFIVISIISFLLFVSLATVALMNSDYIRDRFPDTFITRQSEAESLNNDQQNNQVNDQRFGMSGNCEFVFEKAGDLRVDWFYSWGGAIQNSQLNDRPYNQHEIDCMKENPGSKALFTVGTNNMNWERPSEETLKVWLDRAIQSGKWDEEDKLWYQDVVAVAENSVDAIGEPYPSNIRMRLTYIQIPFLIEQVKGGYYQVANEPDIGLYFHPEDYAKYYHAFYSRIKKYDPTAQVTVGGLGFPDYDHPFKEVDTKYAGLPSAYPALLYDYPMGNLIASANSVDKESYKSGAWLISSSFFYKSYYGNNIPVDFWSVHPYPWSTYLEQDFRTGFVGFRFKPDTIQDAIKDSIDQLKIFKKVIALPEISQEDKPIWVTEFSLLQNTPIYKDTMMEDIKNAQQPYLEGFIREAISQDLADKFFWFIAGTTDPNNNELYEVNADPSIIEDVPISFDRNNYPFAPGITNPEIPESEGKVVSVVHFYQPEKRKNVIFFATDLFYIYSFEFTPNESKEELEKREWLRNTPDDWASNIPRGSNDRLQSFNSFYNPSRGMMQQAIVNNDAWSRTAPCTVSGSVYKCAFPKEWTQYEKFMKSVVGDREIVGFDAKVVTFQDGSYELEQTVIAEGNEVFQRYERLGSDGTRRWGDWMERGVWRPSRLPETFEIIDLYGNDPNPGIYAPKLTLVTRNKNSGEIRFFDWVERGSYNIINYTDGSMNPLAKKYNSLNSSFLDSSPPVITSLTNQSVNSTNNILKISISASDSESGIYSFFYGVGSSAGDDMSILSLREFMTTKGNTTIELDRQQFQKAVSPLFFNIYAVDAYGNKSTIQSIEIN